MRLSCTISHRISFLSLSSMHLMNLPANYQWQYILNFNRSLNWWTKKITSSCITWFLFVVFFLVHDWHVFIFFFFFLFLWFFFSSPGLISHSHFKWVLADYNISLVKWSFWKRHKMNQWKSFIMSTGRWIQRRTHTNHNKKKINNNLVLLSVRATFDLMTIFFYLL